MGCVGSRDDKQDILANGKFKQCTSCLMGVGQDKTENQQACDSYQVEGQLHYAAIYQGCGMKKNLVNKIKSSIWTYLDEKKIKPGQVNEENKESLIKDALAYAVEKLKDEDKVEEKACGIGLLILGETQFKFLHFGNSKGIVVDNQGAFTEYSNKQDHPAKVDNILFGTYSESEIHEIGQTKYFILGSNSLWQHLPDQEIKDILNLEKETLKEKTEQLIDKCRANWQKALDSKEIAAIDDISCVVIGI